MYLPHNVIVEAPRSQVGSQKCPTKLERWARTANKVLTFGKKWKYYFWCCNGATIFDQIIALIRLFLFDFSILYWSDTRWLHTYIHCVFARCSHVQVSINCCTLERATRTKQPTNMNITVGLSSRWELRLWFKTLDKRWLARYRMTEQNWKAIQKQPGKFWTWMKNGSTIFQIRNLYLLT